MANPQKENGYAPIANEILEAVSKCKFNGTQFRILTVVWRYTYGFSRKEHELSVNFIVEATKVTKRQIQKELNNLIEENVLTVVREASFNTTRIIAFNKNYESWNCYTCTPKEHEVNKKVRGAKLNTSPGERLDTSPGERLDTQESNIKTNIKQSSSSLVDDNLKEVMDFYSANLQRGVIETPYNLELLRVAYDDYGYELLTAAMKLAAKEEKKGVGYVEGILRNWRTAGVKSLEDARKHEKEFRDNTKRKGKVKPFNDSPIKYKPLDLEDL